MKSSASAAAATEVPLQVTVPTRVKQLLDLLAVESGRTKRTLVLQGLKKMGITITEEEIAGRRGVKK